MVPVRVTLWNPVIELVGEFPTSPCITELPVFAMPAVARSKKLSAVPKEIVLAAFVDVGIKEKATKIRKVVTTRDNSRNEDLRVLIPLLILMWEV